MNKKFKLENLPTALAALSNIGLYEALRSATISSGGRVTLETVAWVAVASVLYAGGTMVERKIITAKK